MANWRDVIGYMRSSYKIAEEIRTDSGDIFALKLIFNTGDGRSQLVFVGLETLNEGKEEWISIESPFARLDGADLQAIVKEAGAKVCGGLGVVGDLLTFKHSAPLANLDNNELERPLALVVGTADLLEQRFGGGDTF